MGVKAIIRVTSILNVVVLNKIISPENIYGACDEREIGIHELVLVLNLVFEQIQLMNYKHFNIVFPTIYALLSVNKVINLFNEWLCSNLAILAQLMYFA